MRITAVRHGETIENQKHIIQGQTPGTLSNKGIAQAKKLAETLADEDLDFIYSSDLRRCRDTAEFVHRYHKDIPLKYNALLREFHGGTHQGESNESQEWKTIKNSDLHQNVPGGESWDEVYARVTAFLDSIYDAHPSQHVLLITHRGPMLVIRSYVEGIPLEELLYEEIPNAGVFALDFGKTASDSV